MTLVFGIFLIVTVTARFGLRLLGVPLRPWLSPSGWPRYYADVLITAINLLTVAYLSGVKPSLRIAVVIALLSAAIGVALENLRNDRAE